jgi:hypothetical protein
MSVNGLQKEASMKRTLVFIAALFLAGGLAWAGGESSGGAPATHPLFAEGGGCKLPDFTGLSPEQRTAAALAAGFQVSPTYASAPACPVTFNCNRIGNCAAGKLCTLGNIGPCCDAGGGNILCCANNGNIWVQQCPCVCTGFICSSLCESSTDVQWSCF